jgi:hypothetical protein
MKMKFPGGIRPWPDAENIICELLDAFAAECDPAPQVCTWIPADYEKIIRQHPLIVIQRIGGVAAVADQVDKPIIEIGVVSKRRDVSNDLLRHIRAWMLDNQAEEFSRTVRIIDVAEVQGPTMPVWVNPEDRYVKALFTFAIRRPR